MKELTTKEKINNILFTILAYITYVLASPFALLMYISIFLYLPFSNTALYFEDKIKEKRFI